MLFEEYELSGSMFIIFKWIAHTINLQDLFLWLVFMTPKLYGKGYIITNANIWMELTCCPQDLRPDANPFKYFAAKFVYTADHKYFFNVRYWRCCYDAAAFCNKFDSGKSFEVKGGFFRFNVSKWKNRFPSFGAGCFTNFQSFSGPVLPKRLQTFAQLFGLSYSDSRAQPSLGPLNINVHITHISLTFLTRKCRK